MKIDGNRIGIVHGRQIELREHIPAENGSGYSSKKSGTRVADIEVYVDVPKLVAALGHKALTSKSRRTKLQEGAVTLVAVGIKDLDLQGNPMPAAKRRS